MKKELAVLLRGRAFLELGPSLGVGATKRRETALCEVADERSPAVNAETVVA